MSLFIFKTEDKEVAGVDLSQLIYWELIDSQECIALSFYGGGESGVHIANEKDRQMEFLRLTTALQALDESRDCLSEMFIFGPEERH